MITGNGLGSLPTAKGSQTLVLPGAEGAVRVAVGVGEPSSMTTTELRDAAATFSRALPHTSRIAVQLSSAGGIPVAAAARAVVEGAILGRYHFHVRSADDTVELAELVVVVEQESKAEAEEGARLGRAVAEATSLGRDLANAPAG